jgi:hypothetical protein
VHKPVLEIDGEKCETLDHFFDEFGRHLDGNWGRNFDAFNDVLRGGFGTPDGGFVLRWKSSDCARDQLGYAETLRYLRWNVQHCHTANVGRVMKEIAAAQRHEGPTVFDILVEIIRCHGDGGDEAADGVELELA